MRILWLKSDLLLPLDKGGKLRTWHLMRHLAAHHEITYLSFAEPGQMAPDGTHAAAAIVQGMRPFAQRVEVVRRSDASKGSLAFYLDAVRYVPDPFPYAVAKYRSRAFAQRLNALLAEAPYDLLVCDFLFPAVNLPEQLPCPSVIFTHNVESEIWRRHAETKTGVLNRQLYAMQYRRMLRFEGRALARFDGVLAVSDADRETFERLYPGAVRRPVHVVPTGVDVAYFEPTDSPASSRRLVFTGSMDWLPNEDAMQFFCRDVLPLIRAEEPQTSLSIVGRAPTPAVQRLASDHGVEVTGRVDDIRPHVGDAAVYIVPLRIGGGTRLKIFEAMAMGKAIVSTTIGAEGLPVAHDRDVVIADDPRAFASAVIGLMRDVGRRRALESAARRLVVEKYDWSAVAGELERALMGFARVDADVPSAAAGSAAVRVPLRRAVNG